jgi:hypothetical protein
VEPYDKQRSREIRRNIRRVLMDEWDPIGVKDIPEAADEYDGYLGAIYGLIGRDASIAEISEYLRSVEVNQMGIGPSAKSCLDAIAASLKRLLQE